MTVKKLRAIRIQPLPAQSKFLFSKSRHLAFVGGYGSGKTYIACHKALLLASWNKGCYGAIVAPTYPMMRDIVYRTLIDVLDNNSIPYIPHKSEWRLYLPEFDAHILLRSADNPARLKGLNLAWSILDEAAICSGEAWFVLLSRSRDPQANVYQNCITTTPEGFNWVYEEFVEKQRPGYEIVYSSTKENKYLDPSYVESLLASYDAKTAKQYIEGLFTNIGTGVIYFEYTRSVHTRETAYDPNSVVHIGLDFNVAPMVAEAFQVTSDGKICGIHEFLISDNASTAGMCKMIRERFPDALNRGLIWLYPDASGAARKTNGESDHAILRSGLPGAIFKSADSNPRVKDRINAVNGQLRSADGTVSLYLHPNQVELRKDFEQVAWNDKGEDIDKTKDARRTHASDAAGYVIEKLRPVKRRAMMI